MNLQFQKVIDGLTHHGGIADWGCWEDGGVEYCPYYNADSDEISCSQKLMSDAIDLLKEYDIALRMMVYQYCVDSYESAVDIPERFNHSFMSAGETAFKVLGIENGQEVPEDFVWS